MPRLQERGIRAKIFLSACSNTKYLQRRGVKWWSPWREPDVPEDYVLFGNVTKPNQALGYVGIGRFEAPPKIRLGDPDA